ncbi:MAG: hypothetical protein AAGI37_15385 [Planctomycetota bacterium]
MKPLISLVLTLLALTTALPTEAGYPDGMNTYAAYHVLHRSVDPSGLGLPEAQGGGYVQLSPQQQTTMNAAEQEEARRQIQEAARRAPYPHREAAYQAEQERERRALKTHNMLVEGHRRSDGLASYIWSGICDYADVAGGRLSSFKGGVDDAVNSARLGYGNMTGLVSDDEVERRNPVAAQMVHEVERGATPGGAAAIVADEMVHGIKDSTLDSLQTMGEGIVEGDPDKIAAGSWVLGATLMSMVRNSGVTAGMKELDECPAGKEYGSYTNLHESGRRYHGQGDRQRSQVSGRERGNMHNDIHIATDWTPAPNRRQAMKDEAQRIENDGGINNPNNYNQINSPGLRYRNEDGN